MITIQLPAKFKHAEMTAVSLFDFLVEQFQESAYEREEKERE